MATYLTQCCTLTRMRDSELSREPMGYCLRLMLSVAFVVMVISGCSTERYLKPTAISGSHSTVNPACPGAQEVIEFFPESQPWVRLRVYATRPWQYRSEGTELRVHLWLRYGVGLPQENIFTIMFPRKETTKVIAERASKNYLITMSKPTVMVVMSNGNRRELSIPIFEKPYDPKQDRVNFWAHGVQVSPVELDEFTAIFPDMYVNGEKVEVPPIHFQMYEDRYFSPVFNC